MAVRRRVKAGSEVLPVPDAVGVTDDAGRLVAWDCRAVHAFLGELGQPSDCDEDCLAGDHVQPLDRGGVFRHAVAAAVAEVVERQDVDDVEQHVDDVEQHQAAAGSDIERDSAVARWLEENPAPMITFGGVAGHYEPLAGRSVVGVVRAMVAEGVVS